MAASSAIGRNSTPAEMFSWNQACQAISEDSPRNAPAAIGPSWPGSQSRAARYMA